MVLGYVNKYITYINHSNYSRTVNIIVYCVWGNNFMQKVNKFTTNHCNLCSSLEQYNLRVIEYGNVVADTDDTTETEFTHLYRLNYILDGQVEMVVNGKKIIANPHSMLILPPGARTSITNGKMVSELFINFEVMNLHMRQAFNNMIDESFPSHMVFDESLTILELFNAIGSEGAKKKLGSNMINQTLFMMIMVEMLRYTKAVPDFVDEGARYGSIDLYNQAISYINMHLSDNIKVKDIATHINVSENYLYKIFMKHCGHSPQQQILNYRINLSCNYLQNPTLAIKTIAEQLGFASYNHYSAAFRKVKGISPSAYRKQLLNGSGN